MAQPTQKKTRCERSFLLSSESVTDDLLDMEEPQTAVAVAELDACLHQDPESHVACETALKDKGPFEREKEKKQKEKEKAKEEEKKQWDEHDAHIAAYSAADDPWMQLLLM